jgi:hypothetical protein
MIPIEDDETSTKEGDESAQTVHSNIQPPIAGPEIEESSLIAVDESHILFHEAIFFAKGTNRRDPGQGFTCVRRRKKKMGGYPARQ